ncbi:hypothetical protein [Streptomyces iranensis]|uniref:Uncharacterized protein n=1 Tax=Streptomyces iranensis TaxID=576784 RepID=A0ABS4MMU4_9ACTN|nr:hypothetical protein [Streptomyces iranensis]MBP2060601.1 hypothetical protein [Streptomyces iranensis]
MTGTRDLGQCRTYQAGLAGRVCPSGDVRAGQGTVGRKGDDALAISWKGPEGGFGGPVDSFRSAG